MRKLRFLFLLLFSAALFAQGIIPHGNATSVVKNTGGYWSEKWQKIPVTDDATATPNIPNAGKIRFNPNTGAFQVNNGALWMNMATEIEAWSAGTYNNNKLVTKTINGQTYIFKSNANSNTTEPFLNSAKEAWSPPAYGTGTYVGEWSAGSYVAGNVVSKDGYAYYCLTNTNTDPVQLLAPYWLKLGLYEGLYSSSSLYSMNDVVIDGSNQVYLSNYNQNNYSLNYGVVSKWEVINGQPNTTITFWGDSFTHGTGSTGYGNYPSAFSLLTGFNVDNQGVAGETSTQIKTRFDADKEKHKNPTVFWVGYNNNSDPTTVKADIAAMVAALGHDNYLVFEILRSNTDGDTYIPPLNADLKDIYKDRFVELQDYLVSLYNDSVPQDVIDHANNDTPWSLRSDWLHLNNQGYLAVAEKLSGYLEYLTGGEDTYKRHSVSKWVQVTDVQGVGRLPLESLELSYFESNGAGYINAYNGETDTPKILSLQYPSGSELRLLENGGIIKIGNISAYSSGVVDRLARVSGTKELVLSPSIATGYIPFTDSNNNFTQSEAYQNGSGNIGIRKTNPDTEFDVNGIIQSGSLASKTRQGSLSSSQGFFQFTNGSINIDGQIFTKQLQVGNGSVTPTSDGEIAVFESEIKVGAATLPTSAPQLQQVVTDTGNQTIDGIKTYTSPIVSATNATTSTQVPNFGQVQNLTGWAQYSGNNYTIGSPLVILAGNTTTLANNGATSTINTQLPTGVTSFINTSNGKITPQNDGDFYVIDIRFKATSSSVDGVIDIGIDIGGAMGIIRQHTISLRKGIGVEQRVALSFPVFSGATFVANGGEVKVSSIVGNTSIYDVTFVIDRTHKAK